jgi:hypothetical protein
MRVSKYVFLHDSQGSVDLHLSATGVGQRRKDSPRGPPEQQSLNLDDTSMDSAVPRVAAIADSGGMPIGLPGSCRSVVPIDGDHDSGLMPITNSGMIPISSD